MTNRASAKRYKALGARLKLARERANLTQEEVARKLSKPQWFISRSERGTRRVDVIELLEFAKIYRRDLTFFLEFNVK